MKNLSHMKRLRTFVHSGYMRSLAGFLLCGVALACGGTKTDTDTRSNWLSSCSSDNQCDPGASCVCGVCTAPCNSETACDSFGDEAACFEVQGCSGASQVCASPEFDLARFTETEPDAAASSDGEQNSADADVPVPSSIPSPVVDASALPTSSAMDSDECTLPIAAYEALGAACSEEALNCSTVYLSDDCGCWCGPGGGVTDGDPDAQGGGNGSGGDNADGDAQVPDPATPDECDISGRMYASHDPSECGEPPDCGILAEGIGNVPFNDSCGCGCEPYVAPPPTDSIGEMGCVNPQPSGGHLSVDIAASSSISGATTCFNIPNAILRSQAEFEEWLSLTGCSDVADAVGEVDFTNQTLIIAGVDEHPSVALAYSTQTLDGRIHIGVQADAYCGGAQPPSGYLALTLSALTAGLRVDVETCSEVCGSDGGLPKP